METIALNANSRSLKIKPKYIRSNGRIPAVCYGKGREILHVEMEYMPFFKAFKKAGENTIIDLSVDDAKDKFPVLVHDITYDPVTDDITHVDFMFVDMKKEVTTSVKVHTVGVSLAVKDLGGILTTVKSEIRIKCLPQHLIHSIEVDISGLVNLRDAVHVKELNVPDSIKILDEPNAIVVTVSPPKVEEEASKPVEEGEQAVTEGGEDKGKEGEGENAPANAGKATKEDKGGKKSE